VAGVSRRGSRARSGTSLNQRKPLPPTDRRRAHRCYERLNGSNVSPRSQRPDVRTRSANAFERSQFLYVFIQECNHYNPCYIQNQASQVIVAYRNCTRVNAFKRNLVQICKRHVQTPSVNVRNIYVGGYARPGRSLHPPLTPGRGRRDERGPARGSGAAWCPPGWVLAGVAPGDPSRRARPCSRAAWPRLDGRASRPRARPQRGARQECITE
jgi:hypothetical protein